MADGLLNKASIILTPTGYKAGTLYNVAPVVEPYEDFDFARASVASRVNSSGLVEMVGRTLGSNLVLNGDFEELGNQIVNISSLSGNNWTADGDGGFTNNGSGEGLSGSLDVSTIVGKTYKFTFDVTISGIANATFGGVTIPIFTTSGSKEYYVTATSSSTSFSFYLAPSGSPSMFVNNISIKQVDPNDYWTLGTNTSIDNGFLKFNNASSNTDQLLTTTNAKTYKVVFTISNYSLGSVRFRFTGTANVNGINRSSNGTFVEYITATSNNSIFIFAASTFTGSIDNVSVKEVIDTNNIPRISYDSNGENGHILLEPTSTNKFDYTENFDEWSKNSSITITPNSTTSPDGTNNASKVTYGGSGYTFVRQSFAITSDTVSFFVKKGNWRYVGVRNCIESGNDHAVFDFDTESFVNIPTGTTCTFDSHPNGWYRIKVYNPSPQASAFRGFALSDATGNEAGPSGATNGSYFYIWGAQAENLPYATSYIPVHSTTSVTRATETLTGSGNSTLINSTEGVLYGEFSTNNTDSVNWINISDKTAVNWLFIGKQGSNIRIYLRANNSVIFDYETPFTDNNKVALSYKSGNIKAYINGSNVANSSNSFSFTSALSSLDFNQYNGGATQTQIAWKAVAVFNEALSDDELHNLTG